RPSLLIAPERRDDLKKLPVDEGESPSLVSSPSSAGIEGSDLERTSCLNSSHPPRGAQAQTKAKPSPNFRRFIATPPRKESAQFALRPRRRRAKEAKRPQ